MSVPAGAYRPDDRRFCVLISLDDRADGSRGHKGDVHQRNERRVHAGAVDDPQENAKREALEHKIADALSSKLVAELQKAGLPAVRWTGTPPKNKDAYILEGQFLTNDESSGQKIVGLALGGTELRVLAQLYHLEDGQKQVFSKVSVGQHGLAGKLAATKLSASKAAVSVNTAVGAVQDTTSKVKKAAEETASTIVGLLKPKMQEQGWF